MRLCILIIGFSTIFQWANAACGAVGQNCCPGRKCNSPNTCKQSSNKCIAPPCGGLGQGCCSGSQPACTAPNVCTTTRSGSQCTAPCGGLNEACCTRGTPCTAPNTCRGSPQKCLAPCGALGQACCGRSCNSLNNCVGGTCTAPPCGDKGEPCCQGTTCNSPYVCPSSGRTKICTQPPCGGLGETCCPGSFPCRSGNQCRGTPLKCAPPCGKNRQTCCDDSACDTGLYCGGRPRTCGSQCGGSLNAPCCDSSDCKDAHLTCVFDIDDARYCVACGQLNQPCCTNPVAGYINRCDDDTTLLCQGRNPFCGPCGGDGQFCCNINDSDVCNSGFACIHDPPNAAGICHACGGTDQPTCP